MKRDYTIGSISVEHLDRQLAFALGIPINHASKIINTLTKIIINDLMHRKSVFLRHIGKLTIHRWPRRKNPLYHLPSRRGSKKRFKITPPRNVIQLKICRALKKEIRRV